ARTVITTNGEADDMNSVLRALLYANDMDIAGIVITSSMYHYAGDAEKGIEPFRWTGTQWIYDFLDDYEAVYENLKAHDETYPSADSLRAVTKIGNITNVGEMEEVTEGSEFLKELFLDDDERNLYVQTWGGTNTTARALLSIEEEYKDTDKWEAIQQKIYDKLVVYMILDQDDSYSDYIAVNWPGLKIINDRSNFWRFAYLWTWNNDEVNETLHSAWEYENIIKDKGVYMENYALMGDGKIIEGEDYGELRGTDDYLEANPEYERYDFISEGDSPSFLYLIDTGLRSLEDPSYGGWGSRFTQESETLFKNNALDYSPYSQQYEASYTLTRWFTDIQNDFAERINWTLTADDSAVNHAPTVSVRQGIDITAAPGETVTAVGEDKDGDTLSYRWWHYFEADTDQPNAEVADTELYEMSGFQIDVLRQVGEDEILNAIEIINPDEAEMSFTVPEDAKAGDTIHMIVEVKDDGSHTLKHYQRVIITVK
ncbi:MAG: DUF1593 domain-containing protein, partial [Solobacterium sp.]|nr:DUF1593 domain-containing protein [Solobacterium sp.]